MDNDGLHGAQTKQGTAELRSAGYHDITIAFFENGGGSILQVSWSPVPGAALAPLEHTSLSNRIGCGNMAQHGTWKLLLRQTGASKLGKQKWFGPLNPSKPNGPNYSILNTLSDKYKDPKNGKFTFKLVYPRSTEANAYNIWKQETNPAKDSKVTGYQEVDVNIRCNRWGGLEKSGSGALADGSVNHGNVSIKPIHIRYCVHPCRELMVPVLDSGTMRLARQHGAVPTPSLAAAQKNHRSSCTSAWATIQQAAAASCARKSAGTV